MIAEWKFEALDVEHSNRLLKTLGKEYVTDEPMILTDIYNLEEELNVVQKDLGKIGFKNKLLGSPNKRCPDISKIKNFCFNYLHKIHK